LQVAVLILKVLLEGEKHLLLLTRGNPKLLKEGSKEGVFPGQCFDTLGGLKGTDSTCSQGGDGEGLLLGPVFGKGFD
jgi:hypothetical protein